MRAGADHAGPEDAFGMGAKRGDYSRRIGDAHYHPHTALTPQRPLAQGNIGLIAPVVEAGESETTYIYTIEAEGDVTGAVYIPNDDIAGAATDNRKLSLVNGGANGQGSTEMAALSFTSGTDAAAGDEKALSLSGTSANLEVSDGDQLIWKSAKVGTGIEDPGGTVFVMVKYD